MLLLLALAAVALTTSGCYTTEERTHGRVIYEPSGAVYPHYYYREGRYYAPRDERNRQWYHHDGRYHDRYLYYDRYDRR
jgi:hypothetical protein